MPREIKPTGATSVNNASKAGERFTTRPCAVESSRAVGDRVVAAGATYR
jgi:hypothetical protein